MSNTKSTKPNGLYKDPASSIKTLRKSYKLRADYDAETIRTELLGESDRSAVILLATLLDEVLKSRIAESLCFKPEEADLDQIFRFEGPLGTFSGRIEVASLFGFIDGIACEQLNIVRELRNACAHSMHPAVFTTPTFANVARRMLHPLGNTECTSDVGIRNAIILEGIIIGAYLRTGSRKEANKLLREWLENAGALPKA